MYTVKEVSVLSGVSVRTLHHYDAIGLLRPAQLSPAGYRLYDDAALARLRSILLYRELRFPLRSIKAMLDSPDFDPAAALKDQIVLLEVQRDRTQALIDHARHLLKGEITPMDFTAFDETDMNQYRQEAQQRWGQSTAWTEYEAKESRRTPAQQQDAADRLMALLAEIGAARPLPPDSPVVREKVAALQRHITDHFYTCTDEILAGLGQMYTGDERFRRNIDAAGGEGCAAFAGEAIRLYCSRKK